MQPSKGDTPPIETTFEAWLRALKQGAPWADSLMALRRCVQVMQSRKSWVRANIALAKAAPQKDEAAWCAQQAGDTLWAVMNRPHLALACYRFASENASNPSTLFGLIAELEAHLEALQNMPKENRRANEENQVVKGPWGESQKAVNLTGDEPMRLVGDDESGPDWLIQINALWKEAQVVSDEKDQAVFQEKLHGIADKIACFGEAEPAPLARVNRTEILWRAVPELRAEVIRALRGGEHYESMIKVLQAEEPFTEGEAKREILMELGSLCRLGLDDAQEASRYFERIIEVDKDDREAWGEYLECMEEIGDQKSLLDAISKRCALAQGFERRQLMRRRMELLMETGELKPPSPPGNS